MAHLLAVRLLCQVGLRDRLVSAGFTSGSLDRAAVLAAFLSSTLSIVLSVHVGLYWRADTQRPPKIEARCVAAARAQTAAMTHPSSVAFVHLNHHNVWCIHLESCVAQVACPGYRHAKAWAPAA